MRLLATFFVGLTLIGAQSISARGEDFPSRTIKIIVPTAPGGAIDTTARVVAAKMQDQLGQTVIIENKPGASMLIGADYAAKANPDGYTLLCAHDGTMAINPLAFSDLTYDPQKSFEPLGLAVSIPEAILVNKSVPAKTLKELIDYAKKHPGALTHATGGSATLLSLELFKAMADVDIRSIPYRGGAPAVQSAISGETNMIIADLATGNAALKSDRIQPLAITSRDRSKLYPDLPPADQAGLPGYEVNTWMGFFAPAGTPKPILSKLENAIISALANPDVRARFEALGMVPRSGSANEMREVLAHDLAKWSKLVKERHIVLPH